ncbi:MalY/PatB family protein [Brevibacterium litoralis]|uniref:MalY/PatB family protein n=1 Tax=Brevibacterium litoralis TaxID=3138935 RepID=UPI0032ED23E9
MSSPTGSSHPFDALTADELRAKGSNKWSTYPDTIGAHIAEMDFGVADPVRKSFDILDARDLYGYAPESLYADMRAATRDFYADYSGFRVPTTHIDSLPDVLTAFEMAIRFYSAPGSKIVLMTPAYMPFFITPGLHDREIVEVPMLRDEPGEGAAQDGTQGASAVWRVDYEGLDRAFADGGGLLVLVNPHNPIGKVYTAEELERIGRIVQAHGARVFSDEIHGPLVYAGGRHVPYASVNEVNAGHTVTATAASKAFNLPGLKCAQILFHTDDDLAVWKQKGTFYAHMAANPGLLATIAAYREGGAWLDDVRGYLDGNRRRIAELVASHLPGVRYDVPDGTYIGWLDLRGAEITGPAAEFDLSTKDGTRSLHQFLMTEAKVSYTNGGLCGADVTGCMRLNFALPRPILEEALLNTGKSLGLSS